VKFQIADFRLNFRLKFSNLQQSAICNLQSAICNLMRLYVETMDAVVVEVDENGRVRYEAQPGGDGDWTQPTLQERRAIIYAARQEMAGLTELIDSLDR
jgi:hypothetical protein